MTTPDDPLFERLRRLPAARLDDVSAARTLARAEAAFADAAGSRAIAPAPAALRRAPIPAALALWGLVYCWGAVRELGQLYPSAAASEPAVAADHRGPSGFDRERQFMLNAINKTSASTTTAMTTVPPRPDILRAICSSTFCCALSCTSVPVRSDVSSDMDPSLQTVVRDTRIPSGLRRGADRGRNAARTAARSARAPLGRHARIAPPSAPRSCRGPPAA